MDIYRKLPTDIQKIIDRMLHELNFKEVLFEFGYTVEICKCLIVCTFDDHHHYLLGYCPDNKKNICYDSCDSEIHIRETLFSKLYYTDTINISRVIELTKKMIEDTPIHF